MLTFHKSIFYSIIRSLAFTLKKMPWIDMSGKMWAVWKQVKSISLHCSRKKKTIQKSNLLTNVSVKSMGLSTSIRDSLNSSL